VPITTKVVSSNSLHGEVCSIQHYVITFVSNLRQVCGFFRVLRFPQPIKLIATKVASNFKNQASFHSATKHDSHAQFQIIWLELLKRRVWRYQSVNQKIQIRKSKMNRQHNDQKKKYKRTNNDLQNIRIKPKIE